MIPWIVIVSADIPYPWDKTFSIRKSSPDAAASEAVKLFRKAVKEAKGKSKKLDEIRIRIIRGRDIEE